MSSCNSPTKKAFDGLSRTVLVTDKTGQILYVNNNVFNHTGFSVAESLDKNPGHLWGRKMNREFYAKMWQTIEARQVFVDEMTNVNKGNKTYQETIYIAPIPDQVNNIKYYFATYNTNNESKEKETFFSTFNRAPGNYGNSVNIVSGLENFFETNFPKLDVDFATYIEKELIRPTYAQFSVRHEDAKLVIAAQEEPKLFAILYNKYFDSVYNYCLYHLNARSDLAEEFAQETFMHAYAALPKFVPANASYLTYLRTIALHLVTNHSRHLPFANIDDMPEKASPEPSIAEVYANRDSVQRLLSILSPLDRDIVNKKYNLCVSTEEIAADLDKSVNAVKLALSRARKKMRLSGLS